MRNRKLFSGLALVMALAACGGSDEAIVTGPIPDTDVGVPLPDFDAEPIPPYVLIAETTVAPINGAIITDIVRLEVVGWNMRNVELLPLPAIGPSMPDSSSAKMAGRPSSISTPEPYPMVPWMCESVASTVLSGIRKPESSLPCDRTLGLS